jgi:hypothetical protein
MVVVTEGLSHGDLTMCHGAEMSANALTLGVPAFAATTP